jgi:hypothetical protein
MKGFASIVPPEADVLPLRCSPLQSLRSLPLPFGGDSLLPKLNNCYSLQLLRTVFGVSRVGCSRIVDYNRKKRCVLVQWDNFRIAVNWIGSSKTCG